MRVKRPKLRMPRLRRPLRWSRWLLLPLLLVPLGTGAAAPPERQIVIWHAYRGAEKEAFEKVVADYNAARPARGSG